MHVGAGTFKPVKAETIGKHNMHTEHFVITPETIPPLIDNLNNITAVGTTTVRTLESLHWLGVKLIEGKIKDGNELTLQQWEAYELPQNISAADALNALHNNILKSNAEYINATTAIIIAPGYNFKIIDRLITNFHQPKSTLLLLISAFVGDNWRKVYDYAVTNKFRFLSYGDSCFFNRIN